MAENITSTSTVTAYTKTWEFLDCRDDEILIIKVQELLDADSDYGLYTWPCAVLLSQYLIYRKASIIGKRVVELGAGTALAGLVASRCGASSVLLTDHAKKEGVLQNCRDIVSSQGFTNVQVCGLTWGDFTQQLISLQGNVDLVIAADCFYDTKDFEPVLVTVAYLLETNSSAEFWCTYQVRSADRSFDYLFEKWKLKCSVVPLDEFTDDVAAVCRDCSISTPDMRLLIITRL